MPALVDQIPFNTPVPITPGESVPVAGRIEIFRYASQAGSTIFLPDWWHWGWEITDKEHKVSGSLPKRIANFHYKATGQKLPEKLVSDIGEIAKRYLGVDKQVPLIFDFDKKLNWNAGDFADTSSCYWTTNTDARGIIRDGGGFAMRRWTAWVDAGGDADEETEELEVPMPFIQHGRKGTGRCWVVPLKTEGAGLAMFNVYDPSYALPTFGQALALYLGLDFKMCGMNNHGRTSGMVYINGSGCVVGEPEWIKTVYTINLSL